MAEQRATRGSCSHRQRERRGAFTAEGTLGRVRLGGERGWGLFFFLDSLHLCERYTQMLAPEAERVPGPAEGRSWSTRNQRNTAALINMLKRMKQKEKCTRAAAVSHVMKPSGCC